MAVQRPILTVTLNPALDVSARTGRVMPGPKLRLEAVRIDPGGGGVNVARAVMRLGGQASAFVVLGGSVGDRLAGLLLAEGVPLVRHAIPAESRESLAVTDAAGAQWRFVLPGPEMAGSEALLDAIAAAAAPDAVVVLSGSQPPGVAAGFPTLLARALPGRRLIVDTSGPALQVVAKGPTTCVHTLRMDQSEAEVIAGAPLATLRDVADLAERLVKAGAADVVIAAHGADGNVLADGAGRWLCRPPPVQVVSTVGAGDSFTAGYALALALGQGLSLALQAGTAAAAAAVMTPGTELCRRADAERLLAACVPERV